MDLSEFRTIRTDKCKVSRAFKRLSDDERIKVKAALEDPTIPTTGIERWWLERDSDPPLRFTIDRHRKGTCPCARPQ